jgi:hypothetical protein
MREEEEREGREVAISCSLLARQDRNRRITSWKTSMAHFRTQLWTTISLVAELPRLGQQWDRWQKTTISFRYFGQFLTAETKQNKKTDVYM